jgi:hypothetical protein
MFAGLIQRSVLHSPALAAPPLWTPADLGSKLVMWQKADTLAGAGGSSLASWADASGNSRNLTAAAAQPTVKAAGLNGLKTVQFVAASSQYFDAPAAMLSALSAGAAFVVFKINTDPPGTTAVSGAPLDDWGSDSSGDHGPWVDGHWYSTFGTSARKDVSPVTASTAFRILGLRSAASDWRMDIDGTNVFTTGTNTVGWGADPQVAFSTNGTGYMDGEIAEIVFCNDFLTTTEKEKVEGYLAHKWWGAGALNPLPGGHTYKSAAP